MIQDIFPSKLDNHYEAFSPRPEDTLVICDSDGRLLVNTDGGRVHFPVGGDAAGRTTSDAAAAVYLFSLDGERYFLRADDAPNLPRIICGDGTATTAFADGAAGRLPTASLSARFSARPAATPSIRASILR